MSPRIIFRRSWLYDQALRRDPKFISRSDKELDRLLRKIELKWRTVEKKILQELSHVLKMKWREKEIVVYLSEGVIPFSDPLTLNARSDIHTLTHELIHRIISEPENWKKCKKNWFRTLKKFEKESLKTRTHIIIHAIHMSIFKKFFTKKDLQAEVDFMEKYPDYKRAWEIVYQHDYQIIIKQFTKNS